MKFCKSCLNEFVLMEERKRGTNTCDWCFYIGDGRNFDNEREFENLDSPGVQYKKRRGSSRHPELGRLPTGIFYNKQLDGLSVNALRHYVHIAFSRFETKEEALKLARIFRKRMAHANSQEEAYYAAEDIRAEHNFYSLKKKINPSLPNMVRYTPNMVINGKKKKNLKVIWKKSFIKNFMINEKNTVPKILKEIQKILIEIENVDPETEPEVIKRKFSKKKLPVGLHFIDGKDYIAIIYHCKNVTIKKRIPVKLFGLQKAIILGTNIRKQADAIPDMNERKKFVYERVNAAIKSRKREDELRKSGDFE